MEPRPINPNDIDNRFTFHPATGSQPERYESIRDRARSLAHFLNDTCPPGRELSTAITKLQEVVMWANAAIACNED